MGLITDVELITTITGPLTPDEMHDFFTNTDFTIDDVRDAMCKSERLVEDDSGRFHRRVKTDQRYGD